MRTETNAKKTACAKMDVASTPKDHSIALAIEVLYQARIERGALVSYEGMNTLGSKLLYEIAVLH